MYVAFAEDRKSVTLVETVCADGSTIPPVIIVQGKQHMESWYSENLTGKERILLSNTGFTNIELAQIYLDHFIEHIKDKHGTGHPPIVLLMDQHGSHMHKDLIIKATTNNIHLYPFPGHLTHILQPLDVGVFQPYKHWHKKAVQNAMRNLDVDYNVASFFRDLKDIRENTFKKGTIIGAFRTAGIWPINCKVAISKMKIYAAPERPTSPLELP